MGDPAEYYYGEGLLAFLNGLGKSKSWERPNNKIAIVTGSQNYSMVIANAIKDNAEKYGWDISLFETVVVPISEWGPTLSKIRNDPPAVIAVTHWVPQDLAQFMIQFVPNPTNSLVYMQYGPSLAAFREIGKEWTNGVLYSTVIAALQDDIGQAFIKRYKDRFGANRALWSVPRSMIAPTIMPLPRPLPVERAVRARMRRTARFPSVCAVRFIVA